MVHFSYCFCLTLIHSLWQAAVLFCIYHGFNAVIRNTKPVVKRNILFSLLFAQVLISISTFFIYYSGSESFYTAYIPENIAANLSTLPLLERLAPWLIGAYCIVLLFKSVHLVYNWIHFKGYSNTSWIKPSAELRLFTKVKSFQFGIRRKVTLWYSSNINTPMTFGFFKPVILLPVALLNNLSIQETETLIIHELTHIRNNDYFLNWLLVVFQTIFFFNPFVQAIGNRVRLEREKNCDTHVLQFNYPAISYAETLLKAATFKTNTAPFFLAAALKNTQLLTRIHFFTKENNLRFAKRNYAGLAITCIAIIILLNFILLNSIRQQKKDEPVALTAMVSYPVNAINENLAKEFSTAMLPLAQEASHMARQVSGEAAKERLRAVATKELAEIAASTEKEIPAPDYEAEPENIAVPVTLPETIDSKEITLKEESSATGKAVTKVFQMKWEDGAWKMKLRWTITETRPSNDSAIIVRDTTHYFNPVQ